MKRNEANLTSPEGVFKHFLRPHEHRFPGQAPVGWKTSHPGRKPRAEILSLLTLLGKLLEFFDDRTASFRPEAGLFLTRLKL